MSFGFKAAQDGLLALSGQIKEMSGFVQIPSRTMPAVPVISNDDLAEQTQPIVKFGPCEVDTDFCRWTD